ncbi:MAG: uroporphyrinogen decarboxylase [bacterium]
MPVDCTPVWIMRQAGRYLPEYRKIREKVSFLTLCKTPDLAAEVTCQPVDILGVDAAILFSDILIPLEAMGSAVDFTDAGPQFRKPVSTEADVKGLLMPDPVQTMPFVFETIRILRGMLRGKVPLIGFAGAPFTLTCYLVEGGSSTGFYNLKRLMFREPAVAHLLLDKISEEIVLYLNAQTEAGVQAVQLFDTWAGILTPQDYKEFAFPYVRRVIDGLRGDVPVILYVNGCCGLIEMMEETGADVISVDWRIGLDAVRARLKRQTALQGNLDPAALYLPEEKIGERVADVLQKASGAQGHIFNLGHGILPDTPVEHAVAMVKAVHRFSLNRDS